MSASTTATFRHSVLRGWSELAVSLAARVYLVFVLALAACALVPMIAGMTATVVHGSSMRPHIVAGDVALSVPFDQSDEIPLGRVVSFEAPAGSGRNGLILHRIVAITDDGDLVTAGDGNPDVDAWVIKKTDVLSVAHLLIPWAGLPTLWAQTGDVLALVVWIVATVAALAVELLAARGERPRHLVAPHSGRLAVMSVAVVALPFGVLAGVSSADAAFSGQTYSVGSAWTAATSAPATKLVFTTSPSGSTGGVAWASQPVVKIVNAAGTTKTGTRTVTLALTSAAGAVLKCTTDPIVTTTGVATFAGCAIDKAGTYTLTASSGSLTSAVSQSIKITAGAAAHLAFAKTPGLSSVNAVIPIQPVVAATDAGGNIATTGVPISLKLTSAGGATLTCAQNPVTTTAGSATFTGCRVSKAGTYTLTASSGSLAAAVSASFTVTTAPALTCTSSTWLATFRWTSTPRVATTYHLYVNGIAVPATGADGWNSYVQVFSDNVPAATFPAGTDTVEVRKLLANGTEQVIGTGRVVLGTTSSRTYTCG